MNAVQRRRIERASPLVAAVILLVLWQAVCSLFGIADFIFPSPWTISQAMVEFFGPIMEAAWKTF